MFATNISNITSARRKVKVDIQADTVPDSLPATGEDVSNLANDVTFEVGSSLLVVPTAEVYLYGEDGEWHLTGSN